MRITKGKKLLREEKGISPLATIVVAVEMTEKGDVVAVEMTKGETEIIHAPF